MKKFILTILVIFIMPFALAEIELRGYDEFDIPTGTHIAVISLQEFSTAYCEEGDKVNFEATSDIYLYNKDVIPTGTKFSGYIDKKNVQVLAVAGMAGQHYVVDNVLYVGELDPSSKEVVFKPAAATQNTDNGDGTFEKTIVIDPNVQGSIYELMEDK